MMYRLSIMSSGVYGIEIGEYIAEDAENIDELINQGELVFICDDLGDAAKQLGIEETDIILVKEE